MALGTAIFIAFLLVRGAGEEINYREELINTSAFHDLLAKGKPFLFFLCYIYIDGQMEKRSCIVVLIGEKTSQRKWVKYEISKAYELKKGIVGVYVNKLKDENGEQSDKGANPFYSMYTEDGHRLSEYVVAFEPSYSESPLVYYEIKEELSDLIEDAISNSGKY